MAFDVLLEALNSTESPDHEPEESCQCRSPLEGNRRLTRSTRCSGRGATGAAGGATGTAGAINMVTPEKRRRAADLVKSGRAVSLGRPLPVQPSVENPQPVQHYMRVSPFEDGSGGFATDYIGVSQHGYSVTHIDALCHHWGGDGMWDGPRPRSGDRL